MSGEGEDRDMAVIRQHVAALGEHFDTVQVFATRHEGDKAGTVNCHFGTGNWFARFGHVRMWVKAEEASSRFDSREDWEK